MDEMSKLRFEEYGSQAREFIHASKEVLVMKGWNVPSIGWNYVKASMIIQLFHTFSVQQQKSLLRELCVLMSKKFAAQNPKASQPAKDDYSEKLWQNGFSSQSTQKYLF